MELKDNGYILVENNNCFSIWEKQLGDNKLAIIQCVFGSKNITDRYYMSSNRPFIKDDERVYYLSQVKAMEQSIINDFYAYSEFGVIGIDGVFHPCHFAGHGDAIRARFHLRPFIECKHLYLDCEYQINVKQYETALQYCTYHKVKLEDVACGQGWLKYISHPKGLY